VYTAAVWKMANHASRCALIAKPATRRGLVSRLACIFASIAPACTVTWACIYRLFGTPLLRCSKVRSAASKHFSQSSTNLDTWQLTQLRTMKVGGNGSATDFFTRHGGASLLNDSDTKKKYTSRVADLYREELTRRVKEDVAQLRHFLPLSRLTFAYAPNSTTKVPRRHFCGRCQYLQNHYAVGN